jgi:MoaA/NifB/PqqE/SkfB family radical SAM enzyme
MNCRHCLYSSGKRGEGEMNFVEIKKIIDEFNQISNGRGTINIFGGEVFLREDIFDVIDYIISSRLKIGITTNVNLPDEVIKKISSRKIGRITIDLDGGNAESHEWLRNKKGHFNQSLRAIEFFVKSGIFTATNVVLHNKNADEIESILELCRTLKLNFVSFYLFTPLGRGKNISNLMIDAKKWKELRGRVEEWIGNNQPEFGIIWERSYEFSKIINDLPVALCSGCPSDVLDIRYDGNVYYCGLLSAVDYGCLGNVKKEKLSEIINKREKCAVKIETGCSALAYANNPKELIDPRSNSRGIVPVCPYDWEVLHGIKSNLKDKFAHIDL